MAEYDFGITAIKASLSDQCIYVKFTLDLDTDTVNPDNIFLAVRDLSTGKNNGVPYDISVDGNIVKLALNEWAVPNTRYTLLLQPGIRSITDECMDTAVVRNFVFESEVTSTVAILTPADFERISNTETSFTCTWEETGSVLVHNYYIEIATDNSFFNTVIKTVVNDKYEYTTNQLEDKQYYIRIRAQKDEQYGYWSPMKTFVIQTVNEDEDQDNNNGNESTTDPDTGYPEIVDTELTITSKTENGITPLSFDIVFSDDIDASEVVIEIVRSDF